MTTLEQLDARLTELELRAGPVPLANPPITVGELLDVPAPGSPIASPWAQEISNRIVHRFATTALMKAWNAAAGAVATTGGRLFVRIGTDWQTSSIAQVSKVTSSEYINLTAAEFGLSKLIFLSAVPGRDAGNTVFIAGWGVAADGLTASARIMYVDAGGVVRVAGNGSTIVANVHFVGNA